MQIDMKKAGIAWRGFFPVGAELTSGKPDKKEGLYFGKELSPNDPAVKNKTPLHGQNQWPTQPEFKPWF
jgi:isopenicillin N synthase-like dioxygenase